MSSCLNDMWLRLVGGALIGLAGVGLAVFLHLSLFWMLGALLATAAIRVADLNTFFQRPFRNASQWVLGMSLEQLFLGRSLSAGFLPFCTPVHRRGGPLYGADACIGLRVGGSAVLLLASGCTHADFWYDARRHCGGGNSPEVLQLGVLVVTVFHAMCMVFVVLVTGSLYTLRQRRFGP